MAGIRRVKGTAPKQCPPLLTEDIQAIVYSTPNTLIGIRDKALIALGFGGAFRASELVGLAVEDLTFSTEGVRVVLRHSKTDPTSEGRVVAVARGLVPATCPVRAVEYWLSAAGITTGKIFRGMNRHGQVTGNHLAISMVDRIIRRATTRAGLPAVYTPHALRAGHCTCAARANISERIIAKTTGHRSMKVLRMYIREGDLWRENSSAHLGL